MPQPLKVLLVEDNPDDAKLVLRELKRAGFDAIVERVETEAAFLDNLKRDFEVVLSDYSLPEFNGLRALELLNKSGREVPFIIVSGTIGEESAVEAMKLGAADYLLKDRLARLGPAIRHALEQARLRKESRQAQEALRATHAQMRQLLDNSPAVLYAFKVAGEKVSPSLMSENISGLLGITVPEVFSYGWWLGQIHAEDRDRAVASIAATLAQGTSATEYRLKHQDGSYRWVDDKRRLIRDAANRPTEMVGVWTDITELKEAEEARRASEDRLRLVTENARVGLVMLNRERRYIYANAAYAEMFSLPSANIVGQRVADVLAPLYEEQIRPRLDRAFAGERVAYELHKPGPDAGTYYAVRYESMTEGGAVVRVVVVITDITELKQAELARQTSEGRYRALFEHAPDGIVISTPEIRYLDANASMCRMLGYRRDEFIGLHGSDIVVPSEVPHIAEAVSEMKATSSHHREWQFRRKDGSVFEAEVIATKLPDGNLLGMVRDVTERKQAGDELRRKTAFLEAQVDSSLDGILVVDSEGRRTLQNQKLIQLFHVPDVLAQDPDDSKMLQYATSQIRHPEQFLERVTYLYAHPAEISRDEIELADGRILDRYSAPVLDQQGRYYGRIWSFRDITERKRAEAEIQEQLDELRRWHEAMMGREERILELKGEVDELLVRAGQPARYPRPATP